LIRRLVIPTAVVGGVVVPDGIPRIGLPLLVAGGAGLPAALDSPVHVRALIAPSATHRESSLTRRSRSHTIMLIMSLFFPFGVLLRPVAFG
jgi:hypothetical protein